MLSSGRHSRKREAILQCLRETTEHPSAEQIYARLKPKLPDLSLGTVYRNLAAFKREGMAISVGTVEGHERYDGDLSPHDHFVCSRCGTILDLDISTLSEDASAQVCRCLGVQVSGYRLNYYGLCSKCAEDK